MRYIFSYVILVFCWMFVNVKAADFRGDAVKDTASFTQKISKNTQLFAYLSDLPTTLMQTKDIAGWYPSYKSNLPVERLIPFNILNEKNQTILSNAYIPFTLLLKRQAINTFFQLTPSAQYAAIRIGCNYVISLPAKMLLGIAQKIEEEHMVEQAEVERMMMLMQLNLQHTLEEQESDHRQQIEHWKLQNSRLSSEIEERKNAYTKTVNGLKKELNELNEANRKKEQGYKELMSRLILQRNIVLCLIPLFVVITSWWHSNIKTITP